MCGFVLLWFCFLLCLLVLMFCLLAIVYVNSMAFIIFMFEYTIITLIGNVMFCC